MLSKPKKFGLQWRFHLSSDYEKDTFSFFAEGFELPHLTRQFKNKYCFSLSFSGDTRCFLLDMGVRIAKFFRFRFLFYTFSVFLSSLKVQPNSLWTRMNTGFITKTPLLSKPQGFRFQWCFHMAESEGFEPSVPLGITWFRVRPVMTTSITLRIRFIELNKELIYFTKRTYLCQMIYSNILIYCNQ